MSDSPEEEAQLEADARDYRAAMARTHRGNDGHDVPHSQESSRAVPVKIRTQDWFILALGMVSLMALAVILGPAIVGG